MPNPTNLSQYYQGQGQALPSVSQRSSLYSQQGGQGSYTGSLSQNTFLLGKLTKTPPKTTTINTSGMAKKTFNKQQQNFNALDQSVQSHTQSKGMGNARVSIVDLLASQGKASDYASRVKLANQLGIQNYTGSSAQNQQLIQLVGQGQNAQQGQKTTTETQGQPSVTKTTTPVTEAETPASPTVPQTYEQKITDIESKQQDLIDQQTKDLDAIRRGTFPLSRYEQAQIDATEDAFDDVRQQQQEANRSYAQAQENAQFRSGRQLTDPMEFQAKNHQIISDNLRKINTLDTQAAVTMNELKQSFMDKDYKMVNEKYDMLYKMLENKAETITKIQERADKMANDLRDYNLQVAKFQLDKEKTYTDIAKIKSEMSQTGEASLGNGQFGQNVKTALAGIKFSSVADRKTGESAIASLLAQGDIKGAQDQLRIYAYNGMTTDEQQKIAGKQDAIRALDNIETKLAEFQAAGGNTNIFTGLKQKGLEKVGSSAGSLSGIANDIALAIIDYRKAVSGAAFTESEAKQYETIFPSTGKTPALNAMKIKSLKDKFNADMNSSFGRRIPKYNDINNALNMLEADPLNVGTGGDTNNDPLGLGI